MDNDTIKNILEALKSGRLSVKAALDRLKHLPYEDVGVAKVDHHRALRHGIPEVIFASGKKAGDIKIIARSMVKKSGRLLITRATENIFRNVEPICKKFRKKVCYHEKSGTITAGEPARKKGLIAVLCAGTSDLPVAEEAAVTASFLGSRTETVSDVGVAGLHRIVDARKILSESNAVIVVAGMEGALPSVVGGMTDRPIIAVPTSVGYGTSLGGITPLFAMLNSCVPGIAVMNIDNGFGAGVLAHKINILMIQGVKGNNND